MANRKMSGLENALYNALSEEIDLLEELLDLPDIDPRERQAYREQQRQARVKLRRLVEQVQRT